MAPCAGRDRASSTGDELVSLLRSLADGDARTVVLVTHDPSIAGQAARIVRRHDGAVVTRPEASPFRVRDAGA